MSANEASALRVHVSREGSNESFVPRMAFEEQRPRMEVETVQKQVSQPRLLDIDDGNKETLSKTNNETEEGSQSSRKDWQIFFSSDPVIAAKRKEYFKIVGRATFLTIILTWLCLPIYWGSLSAAPKLTGNLEAWVVNRDQARFGNNLENAVQSVPTTGRGALGWRIVNASHFDTDEDVAQAVQNEQTWLAVVVAKNATARLSEAQRSGDVSYDPTSALTVYYAQARNEIAVGTYLLPLTTNLLSNFTVSYATSMAQRYFATIILQNGTVNESAINSIARAPQTISPGIGYKLVNLRPYTASVAQAPLLVGQIYLCIFAFILVMAHSTARDIIKPYISFSSYLTVRVLTPLMAYVPLTMSYALVSLAFKLPFGSRPTFTYGEGFISFFAFLYLGMASLGFALESMVTILTPKFVPFFLVLLIIVNISTAALPPELTSRLYNYGTVFHFWNIQQALRTIFFDTKSYLPKNAGILLAWVLLSIGLTVLFTWLRQWWELRRNLKMDEHIENNLNTPSRFLNPDYEKSGYKSSAKRKGKDIDQPTEIKREKGFDADQIVYNIEERD